MKNETNGTEAEASGLWELLGIILQPAELQGSTFPLTPPRSNQILVTGAGVCED